MAASPQAASLGGRRRKTHNKSRNGCLQCKKRHYKCDEIYPTCSNCKRLDSNCSLSASSSPTEPEAFEKQLNIEDLQLLHDWHMGRDLQFSDHNAEESFRQQRGKEIDLGFKHPYVLHLILALAALHLTSTEPTEPKWYYLAISHHGAAIRLARPHIATSSLATSEAIFNFSGFNSLFSFAEPALRPVSSESNAPRDYLGDLIDSFRMARGIRAIIAKDPELLADIGATNNPAWSYDTDSAESTVYDRFPRLAELESLVNRSLEDADQQAAALKAMHNLFINMIILDETPKSHSSASLIQRWAIGSDPAFMTLCEARHPVALVILAYFALLVNRRTNIWFFRRWPHMILDDVSAALQGTQWMQWIESPMQELDGIPESSPINEKELLLS